MENVVAQVPKFFQGGSETFFSLLWTSHIADPTDLDNFLDIKTSPPSTSDNPQDMEEVSFSYSALFKSFLSGSGIPCPALMEDAKGSLHASVDLSAADSPTFRARMFVWAVTGSPSLNPSNDRIEVRFIFLHLFNLYFLSCSYFLFF